MQADNRLMIVEEPVERVRRAAIEIPARRPEWRRLGQLRT
jgi:hypothetical protein